MGPTVPSSATPTSASQILAAQLARFPQIDPRAAIAVAQQEGLGGGIGDGGTSFGPFQLHYGGAYPSFAPQGEQASQAWAWSPQGLDYALRQIQGVAGGLHGAPAVANIVQRFERPADPGGETAKALAAYGIAPQNYPLALQTAGAAPQGGIARTAGASPIASALAPRVQGPRPVSPLIQLALKILNS